MFLFGCRKKRTANPESITTTFDDVAGVDSAKLELAEVVSLMKAAKKENKSKLKVRSWRTDVVDRT